MKTKGVVYRHSRFLLLFKAANLCHIAKVIAETKANIQQQKIIVLGVDRPSINKYKTKYIWNAKNASERRRELLADFNFKRFLGIGGRKF